MPPGTAARVATGRQNASTPTLLIFAAGGIPAAVILDMTGVFLPRFYATMGLSLISVGATFALVRLIDTFPIDLALGWAMDHTRTRLGRYRPWFLLGAPLLMLAVFMLFIPSARVTPTYLFIWYLCLGVGSSIAGLSLSAWGAGLAPTYNQRARLFSLMVSVAVICTMLINLLPALTQGRIQPAAQSGVHFVGWLLLGIIIATTSLVAIATPEAVAPASHNTKFRLADYRRLLIGPIASRLLIADLCLVMAPAIARPIQIFMFHDAKGLSVGAATTLLVFHNIGTIFGAIFWAKIATLIGKSRAMQIAISCYVLFQTLIFFAPRNNFAPIAVLMVLHGVSLSAFFFMTRAMLADYGDKLRLEQGVSRVSLLYSITGSIGKLGSSLSFILAFGALQFVGFTAQKGAHNTPAGILGLELTFLLLPAALASVAAITLIGYPLNRAVHEKIRNDLEERDASDARAAAQAVMVDDARLAAQSAAS